MYQHKLMVSVAAVAIAAAGCTSEAPSNITSADSFESQAKTSIESMLFDQKRYFLENKTFATSMKQLKTESLIETSSYQYKISPQPNTRKGIVVKATSKKSDLRSFTGVVFVIKSGKEQVTLSQMCETVSPSSIAPKAPTKPKKASDRIECPTGSRSSFEIALNQ